MLRRLVACRRGVVSVEAAFVLPVLITLVLGAMEFALLLFTYGAMQTAAREVARQLAVNYATPAEAAANVRGRLPGWSAAAAAVEVSQAFPSDPSRNVYTVQVTMPASEASPVNFFTRATGDWPLRTEVAMKQELPL